MSIEKRGDMGERASNSRYICDFSLALINRTGAYHICRDVLEGCSNYFVTTRYWRFFLGSVPSYNFFWKVIGRLMLKELSVKKSISRFPWPVPSKYRDLPVLFFDPLYVLRADLSMHDVVLCHDVGPLTHEALYDKQTTRLYRDAYDKVRQSKCRLVFVSEATKSAFTELFGTDFQALDVIPLYTRLDAVDGPQKKPDGVQCPFTLSVGAYEARKNYPRIIDAFLETGLADRGFQHIICGPRGHGAADLEASANESGSVRLLGRVSDEELRWLYANASAFVMPSLLEGFGVPAIEAAYRGIPSVLSANSAQEEAVNGNAICVDPLDTSAISDAITRAVSLSKTERDAMSKAAVAHAISWGKSDFISAWKSVLRNDSGA